VSILNRRNAVTGWAVWQLGKRAARQKLQKLPIRRQPPPPTRLEKLRTSPKAIGAVLMAAGAGLAALLRLRRRGGEA
jgi:hypothetical protein